MAITKAQAMHNSTRTRVASSPPAITPTRPAGGVTARTKLKTRAAAGDKPLSGVHEPIKPVHGHQAPGDKRLKHAAGPVRISPVRPPGPAGARVRPTGARRAALASGGALALAACAALVVGVPNAREALWPRTVAITYQDPPSASALRGQAQPGANRPAEASPRPRRTQSQPERPVQAGRSSADASPPPSIEPPRVVAGANPAPSGSGEAKPVQGSSQAALALPPAHMDRPSTAGPFRAVRDCSQCPEMVQLPGGAFAMGGREDPSEKPVHAVTVPPFAIGRFPVTLGEWRRCVAAQACDYDPGGEDASPVRNQGNRANRLCCDEAGEVVLVPCGDLSPES